jgi:glutathione S-transferase
MMCNIYKLLQLIFQPDTRALIRLQADYISRSFVPAFYRYIQAQDASAQIEAGKDFHSSIEGLVSLFERADKEISDAEERSSLGLWLEESNRLSLADILAGPCEYIVFMSSHQFLY